MIAKDLRILVTGASPDNTNRNSVLRGYVREGFEQILPKSTVLEAPLELAPLAANLHKPDLILCFGSAMPDDADYTQLRHHCDKTGAKLIFWMHDDPYEFDYSYKVVGIADYIFSNDKWAASHYNHPNVHHLPLAASEKAHWRPIETRPHDIDVFFCGVAFDNRVRLIKDLLPALQAVRTRIYGDWWPESEIPVAINRRIDNSELPGYYARSRVTLNMGRHFNYANEKYKLVASTPGPRTFEAGMAGACQLYFVESLEVCDYYVPGKEILLFDSVLEFLRAIKSMSRQEFNVKDIQGACQARTVNCHTYRSRAQTMLNYIGSIQG